MGTRQLLEYLGGWVEFRARGHQPHRLVNLALSRGIGLWDIRQTEHMLIARVRPSQFRALRPLARTAGVRLKVLSRGGVPFRITHWRRRWPTVIMLTAALLICTHLSTFIWFVTVEGTETLPDTAILSLVSDHGLRPGVPRRSIDPAAISRHLTIDEELIAWAAVEIQGTRAIVQIAERVPQQAHLWKTMPGDMVAGSDGLMTQVLVMSGMALVRAGDAVTRGDILIQGPAGGRASGVTKALTWYEAYRESPTTITTDIPTGNYLERVLIKAGPWEIILRGRGDIPYEHWQVAEDRRCLLDWRNMRVAVEVVSQRISETLRQVEQLDRRAAEQAACKDAIAHAFRHVPPEARIVDLSVRIVSVQSDVAGVRVRITANEDIGRFVPSAGI